MQIFLVAFSWFFTFIINFFPSWTTIIYGVLVAFGQSNVIILALTIALALVNCGVNQLRQIYGYTILQERNVESASSSDEPFGRRFSFTQILLATQDFNESLVIGKGGFGKVYKGIIHGRPEVLAIKRLNPDSKQGAHEFWREIDTLSKLRHVHLVSLLGYCMERDEMIIVYEYMPRGTIADNLYKFGRDGKERIPLTWEQRLKICIGVARGLDYLHTGFQHGIIHRDVKDTNILLDENLVAKISDFGLSKLGETHDEVSTKVKGTIGYMDPDYIMTHKPSTKNDVYAFGIVLLVVLSGRPAAERGFFKEPKCLLDCYRKCLTKGETNKIIDPCLQGEILTKSLTCFMETVEKCLHRRPKKRPSMAQLVVHLESALEEQIGANAIPSTLSDDTVVAQSFSDRSKEQFEFYEFRFTPITKESIGSLPDERNNTSKDIHEADQHHTQMMKEHDRRIQGRSNKKDANSEEFVSNPKHKDLTFARKHWCLLQCQNGLRIYEELIEVDFVPKSCSRAMKAVGIVEASCEEIFELVMSMDATRYEWDCTFLFGILVEEVDGHTAILYHGLQFDWFSMFVWPRDLCYVRNWRRNDDGSYVVLFRSREHENCGKQPGYVRALIESGGYNISPLKPHNGRPRTQVQHLMQIDLKGWGLNYISSFQQHCLLQMLNSVAGLREYFSQTDERSAAPRIPVMVNMTSASVSAKKGKKLYDPSVHQRSSSLDISSKNPMLMDEDSDDEDDCQATESEGPTPGADNDGCKNVIEEEPSGKIELADFSGNLRRDDNEKARNCWTISDGNNFRVRSKNFCYDKSKVTAGKHAMELVAVDWFKDTKRMDHVARRPGCAAQVASEKGLFSLVMNVQVPASGTHYSMVFYFVTNKLTPGSLLQRFVDGDDDFRNARFKLIPSVPKGSWIVRQSVGSTPCLLGKAVDCTYIRGPKYLEIDVDIGSSTVANGVLGLVIGVITSLVVDMAFLVQANTSDELPEKLIGAVRVSHIELSSAIVPNLDPDSYPSETS